MLQTSMSASAVPASSSAAQISRAHIERLGELRSQYDRLLAQRVEACRNEYTALSSNVLAHLIKTAPRSRPRKVGLMPFSGRPRSPLEWVRFPLRDNQALWRFATARLGVTAAARSERVPRDKARRPSREPHTDHGSQDWPWLYEDFRRKGVQAQPWEATLAADFEQAVTGPLRRALRASGNLANFVRQLRPVAEIQFDPAEAETFLCEKLNLPRPQDSETLRDHFPPNLTEPRNRPLADDDPKARQRLLALLGAAVGSRLIACAPEYTTTATMLRDRLDPNRRRLWEGPILAPRVLVPPGVIDDPIIIWQSTHLDHPSDPSDPEASGWSDLQWHSARHRDRFKSYTTSCSVRGERSAPAHQYFWFTEAPRLVRDFRPAQRWERLFALYYDQNVVAPLRRQWLLARWSMRLERSLPNPAECVLALDLERYRPGAL